MSTLAEYHGACVSGDKPEPPKPKAAIRTAAPQDNQYIQAIKNDVESWNPKRADQELFMASLRNCLISGTIQPEELGMLLGFIKSLMTLHQKADQKDKERYKQLMEALKIDKWLLKFEAYLQELLDRLRDLYDELDQLNQIKEALNNALVRLDNGEGLPLDDDGSLKDKVLEKAIRDYEARKDKKVDRSNAGDMDSSFMKSRVKMIRAKQAFTPKLTRLATKLKMRLINSVIPEQKGEKKA